MIEDRVKEFGTRDDRLRFAAVVMILDPKEQGRKWLEWVMISEYLPAYWCSTAAISRRTRSRILYCSVWDPSNPIPVLLFCSFRGGGLFLNTPTLRPARSWPNA